MNAPLTPEEQELRARCLELAARADPCGAVKLAREYLAFVIGAGGSSRDENFRRSAEGEESSAAPQSSEGQTDA